MEAVRRISRIFLAAALFIWASSGRAFTGKAVRSAYELSGMLSREEYELVKDIEDNPVDPAGDRIEELLILPGFTSSAIKLIKRAAMESERDWIEDLPREVRILVRRYAIFIKSPRPFWRRYKIRSSERRTGPRKEFSERIYLKIDGRDLQLSGQARRYGKRYPVSAYISAGLPLRLSAYAGDLVPDFGLGLVASRPVMIYPFSSRYPLKRSRLISRGSNFYGESIRGGGLGFSAGGMDLAVFSGLRRRYSDSIFKTGTAWTTGSGGRYARGGSVLGFSIVEEEENDIRYRLMGLDARWILGGIETGAEWAFSSRGGWAWVCGLRSSDSAAGGIGLVFYGVHGGYSNNFGIIPANGRKPDGNQRGFALVLEEKITRHLSVKGYLERHCQWEDGERSGKLLTRLRLIWDIEAFDCRLEWKRSEFLDRPLLPYPSFDMESSGYRRNTLKLTVKGKVGKHLQCRHVITFPWSARFSGYLFSSSAGLFVLDGKLRLDLSGALHKSLNGRAFFYGYEPSVEGDFPWRYMSGNGGRLAFGIRYSMWKAKIHLTMKGDSKGERSIYIQTVIRFKTLHDNWN